MKVIILLMCMLLFCCPACAETVAERDIDLVDEWLIFPYMERQCYVGIENSDGFSIGNDAVMVETDGESVTLFMGENDSFIGTCVLNNEKAAVLTMNGDNMYIMFALSQEPLDDEVRRWFVYSAELESTALFTSTRMISDGSSLEYVYSGSSLFVVQGNNYEKGAVEKISDDAFIWRLETDKNAPSYAFTGDYCALFLRSSLK